MQPSVTGGGSLLRRSLEGRFSEDRVLRTRLPQEGAHPSLTRALHPLVLSPLDYPKDQPHVRSTSSRRSQVGAASTPWSPVRDQTIRRTPSPMRPSLAPSPCPWPRPDSIPDGS